MGLMIRTDEPAWEKEYEACTMSGECFRVKTGYEGNGQHIRIFDTSGTEVGHVYQNNYGVTCELRGRELAIVERRMAPFFRMIPVIRSCRFYGFSLDRGNIRERNYELRKGDDMISVRSCPQGIAVKCSCLRYSGQALEVLLLILGIEAIAHYT